MEFDQVIFQRIYKFLVKKKKNAYEESAFNICLNDIRGRLTILIRAMTGDPIDLIGSEREGGWKDNSFYLPEHSYLFNSIEKNLQLYLFRIFYISAQRKMGYNWRSDEIHSIEESQAKALETSRYVLVLLFKEFPLLESIHNQLLAELYEKISEEQPNPDLTWLYGRWMKNSAGFEHKNRLKNVSDKSFAANSVTADTEIKAKQADEIEVISVDKKQQEDFVLTHNFEKAETIDEFDGVWRDFDGDDTLSDDAEALSDQNLKHVIRVDDPVHSVYQAEMAGQVTVSESTEVESNAFHLTYPEWDYYSQSYKRDFCKVFPETLRQSKVEYYQKTMELNRSVFIRLRKIFAKLNNDLEYVRKQLAGDHIDIDTATDRLCDLHAKHTPDDRVYITTRKQKKELSLLFLLDLSLSSDGYAKGNRIIDIEKQVSILFGEVLNEYEIDFQIDGFYSKTRNKTTYITLKAFDQPWSKAKLNIGAVQPEGYTRIGPAIRHANQLLNKRQNRKKWLILLSDGKPNDYDRYEGKYGIKDIKQALRELNANGINSYAVAIEEQAKYYLPQMFGNNHYNILSSPLEMIHSLAKLYKRIESQ
ncbi:nitric oxide reductase activation protein NorD [Reichenbachiella sp.]|uniref:nitric oxide reductase activation protein NorD n=1 Tax=Reichenbachiella sp. TaxID=2184521 RepID=UPI003B5B0FAE